MEYETYLRSQYEVRAVYQREPPAESVQWEIQEKV